MARPPVTVVIPTYNRPEYLEEALRSLEQQTLLPDEVVVVDDGSDPPPQPSSTIPLRLISQANRGPAAAINRGVAEAAGDVVFLLADDDLFHPQRIEAALKAHAKFDLVVCGQTQFASQPSPDQLAIKKTGDGWAERVVADFVDKTIPSMAACSLRRDQWVPLDETYRACEDVEWWIRQAGRSLSAVRIRGDHLLVRKHSGTRHLSGTEARLQGSLRLLEEHAEFYGTRPQARAFRLARVSIMAAELGERRRSLTYAVRALRCRFTKAGVYALLRSVSP